MNAPLPALDLYAYELGAGSYKARLLLVHIARTHDRSRSWHPPGDSAVGGQLANWLAFAAALSRTCGAARLDEFGAIRRWGDRVRAIPGFITMPGIFAR